MIPKVIHYCWFGPHEKSELAIRCMASWKEHCSDFEFKEWNESNTKQFQNKFYRDAYRKKKYAFVSDYIRVVVLEKFGGVYLDMDMLLLKPITPLMKEKFFTGFEVSDRAAFGLFGGVSGHRFFQKMKRFYDTTPFNPFSLPVITHTFKDIFQEENLNEEEVILAPDAFYAFRYENRKEDYRKFISEDSYAVHLWDHSWNDKKEKESVVKLLKNLRIVVADYLFYGYPYAHFKRYFREYSRKLYHKLIGKTPT